MDGVDNPLLAWRSKVREVHHHTSKETLDPATAEAIGVIAEQLRHLTQKVWEIEQQVGALMVQLAHHDHDIEAEVHDGKIVFGRHR